ncbi:hypothetical protein QL285_053763 [Trifolium repens]|nr:hypothetical protein QL285_053763 [Trifolium repens]
MNCPEYSLHRLEPQVSSFRTSLPIKLWRSLLIETRKNPRCSSYNLPLTLLCIPLCLSMSLRSHSSCHGMHGISHLIHINLWYYRNWIRPSWRHSILHDTNSD